MKGKRITEITLEVQETFTIRRSAGAQQRHCLQCDSLTAMLTPIEAVSLLQVGMHVIHREIESGRLHVRHDGGASLLICLRSIQAEAPRMLPGNSKIQIDQIQIDKIQIDQIKENPS